MSDSAPPTPQVRTFPHIAHLEEVQAALERTANYLYKSENSWMVESKPERLLLEVGAYATYFGALDLMSVSETKAVMHAVDETQYRLISGYPEIDDRDALWEKAKCLDLDNDETAHSSMAVRELEVNRRLSMSTGMPADNDDAVADNEPEVLGVAAREHFEDIGTVRQVHGQVALDEEIKAYFRRFAMEVADDHGGSLLISIGQAIAIATACGSVTQVGVAAGILQAADVFRRHVFSKRTRRLRANDVSVGELVMEVTNVGSRFANTTGSVPIVGRVALSRRTLDRSYVARMLGAGPTGRGVRAFGSYWKSRLMTNLPLADQAVAWTMLEENWILKVAPETVMEYSVASSIVAAGGGLAVLGYTYSQREAIYASWRQREYKRLNSMDDAKAWKEEAEQSLAHVYDTNKQNRKAGILTSIRNAFTKRGKQRVRGMTEIQQIEQFINNMNDVDQRIRALLNAPPVEYDMTGRIGTSIVEEVFEQMQAMRIC
tara:strand:+ start:6613 stop:8079 length:1467 start_codon:yes stop_codon:yes gene_type:complete